MSGRPPKTVTEWIIIRFAPIPNFKCVMIGCNLVMMNIACVVWRWAACDEGRMLMVIVYWLPSWQVHTTYIISYHYELVQSDLTLIWTFTPFCSQSREIQKCASLNNITWLILLKINVQYKEHNFHLHFLPWNFIKFWKYKNDLR